MIQALLTGVLIGAFYSQMSVGLNVVWGIGDIVNVAHATLVVLAAYFGYFLLSLYKIGPIESLLLGPIIFFALGIGLYYVLIIRGRVREHLGTLIVFYGLGIVIENLLLIYTNGGNYVELQANFTNFVLHLDGYFFPAVYLIGLAVVCVMVPLLSIFLHYTQVGRAIRAFGEDKMGATYTGVNLNRVSMLTMGIGTATAAPAGWVLSLLYPFNPTTDLTLLNLIIAIVVLGGLGSVVGTVLAGLAIGVIQTLTATFFQSTWLPAISFGILLTILLFRPQGFLGHVVDS